MRTKVDWHHRGVSNQRLFIPDLPLLDKTLTFGATQNISITWWRCIVSFDLKAKFWLLSRNTGLGLGPGLGLSLTTSASARFWPLLRPRVEVNIGLCRSQNVKAEDNVTRPRSRSIYWSRFRPQFQGHILASAWHFGLRVEAFELDISTNQLDNG